MPYTSLSSIIHFGVVLVGFKNASSLNYIQTCFIFLPLKMSKAIISNITLYQEHGNIFIFPKSLFLVPGLFHLVFLFEEMQIKEKGSPGHLFPQPSAAAALAAGPASPRARCFPPFSPERRTPLSLTRTTWTRGSPRQRERQPHPPPFLLPLPLLFAVPWPRWRAS